MLQTWLFTGITAAFKKKTTKLFFHLSLHLSLEPYTFSACCFPERVLRCVRRINHWGESQDHCTGSWLASSSLHVLGVIWQEVLRVKGLPGSTSGKEPICQCRGWRRHRFDSWVGRSPAGSHGNPLQYSCLEKPMDRRAWRTTVHRVTESDTTEAIGCTHALRVKASV